jgi:hypothetical protein
LRDNGFSTSDSRSSGDTARRAIAHAFSTPERIGQGMNFGADESMFKGLAVSGPTCLFGNLDSSDIQILKRRLCREVFSAIPQTGIYSGSLQLASGELYKDH